MLCDNAPMVTVRTFNTEGPVVAADHYCIPPLEVEPAADEPRQAADYGGHACVIPPVTGRGSVGVGGAAVSGVESVLEPVEGGLVDSGSRFDDGPGDFACHEPLDGLHLAAQFTS